MSDFLGEKGVIEVSEVFVRCPCGGELAGVAQSLAAALDLTVCVCIDCGEPVALRGEERIPLGDLAFPAALAVSLRERIGVVLEEARLHRLVVSPAEDC